MEPSQLENLHPKHLVYIAQKMIDEGFSVQNPYEEFDVVANELTEMVKYFGVKDISRIDIEFLASFINVNDEVLSQLFDSKTQNKQELYSKLEIPKPEKYTYDVVVTGHGYVTEIYKHTDLTYNPEWIPTMVDELRYNSDEFEYYDGELTNTLVEEFEVNNLEVDDIFRVMSQSSVKESILKRLVIENTESMIDSLDFQTLIELKRIIEKKLHSL
jgi:hypothetical protein